MKTRNIIPFTATPTNQQKNYYPPLLQACADGSDLSLPNNVNCGKVAWKVYYQSKDKVTCRVLMVIFAKDDNLVGRAKFDLNANTGMITNFHFEGAAGFTIENMFEPHRVHIHELAAQDAHIVACFLVYYFASINATEEAKMKATKFLSHVDSSAAQFDDKSDSEDEYDPSAPLTPTYVGHTDIHHKEHQFSVDETQVRGFYRYYWVKKNGERVRVKKWITPHVRHYR